MRCSSWCEEGGEAVGAFRHAEHRRLAEARGCGSCRGASAAARRAAERRARAGDSSPRAPRAAAASRTRCAARRGGAVLGARGMRFGRRGAPLRAPAVPARYESGRSLPLRVARATSASIRRRSRRRRWRPRARTSGGRCSPARVCSVWRRGAALRPASARAPSPREDFAPLTLEKVREVRIGFGRPARRCSRCAVLARRAPPSRRAGWRASASPGCCSPRSGSRCRSRCSTCGLRPFVEPKTTIYAAGPRARLEARAGRRGRGRRRARPHQREGPARVRSSRSSGRRRACASSGSATRSPSATASRRSSDLFPYARRRADRAARSRARSRASTRASAVTRRGRSRPGSSARAGATRPTSSSSASC